MSGFGSGRSAAQRELDPAADGIDSPMLMFRRSNNGTWRMLGVTSSGRVRRALDEFSDKLGDKRMSQHSSTHEVEYMVLPYQPKFYTVKDGALEHGH